MEAATRLVEETTLQISPTFDNPEDAKLESDSVMINVKDAKPNDETCTEVRQNSISNIEFEQSPEDGGTIISDRPRDL